MAVVEMKQLLESGVHFGHQTRRWNPKMDPYIYTSRHGIHILDLQKTVTYIEDMYQRFVDIAKDGGKVLFVGTKKQAADAIIEEAVRSGHYYVSKRWLGGTLTNFKTIRKSIRRLTDIERMEEDGTFQRLPKKEVIGLRKEMERLTAFLSGIKEMRTLPQAVFIIDPLKEINAIKEARKLKIPVYGVVDTNCDPDDLDFFIPANDDAIRSIRLLLKVMANALLEGAGGEVEEVVTQSKEERDQNEANRKANERKAAAKPADLKEAAPVEVESPKADAPDAAKAPAKKTASKEPAPKEEKPVAEKAAPKKAKAPAKEATPKDEAPAAQKPAAKKAEAVDLDGLSVADLKALAKARELSGYSKLKKAELIELLK